MPMLSGTYRANERLTGRTRYAFQRVKRHLWNDWRTVTIVQVEVAYELHSIHRDKPHTNHTVWRDAEPGDFLDPGAPTEVRAKEPA